MQTVCKFRKQYIIPLMIDFCNYGTYNGWYAQTIATIATIVTKVTTVTIDFYILVYIFSINFLYIFYIFSIYFLK